MNRIFFIWIVSSIMLCFASKSEAQAYATIPTNPTAADSVTLQYRINSVAADFVRDSYRVSMANNRIRVTLGEVRTGGLNIGLILTLQIDLGRLPTGTYVVDIYSAKSGQPDVLLQSDFPLTVTDNRIAKAPPFVSVNYADHWWNPAESGWGLFIWHDNLDRVLAAWFTYGADNRADWYTIQGGSWIGANEYQGQIIKTTGPVFSAFAPGSNVQLQSVGTAKLFFSDVNNGLFTYTLNGVTQNKVITRFKQ